MEIRRVRTQRKCECGEQADYEYPITLLGKPDVLHLCAHCLIHELEMQLELSERRRGALPPPTETELSSLIRRYVKLERVISAATPVQQKINVDRARRLLMSLVEGIT